jgi:hypothetical protein
VATCALSAEDTTAERFTFVALGDTTYAIPADNPLYEQLIEAINAAQPAFSIHVGDTKGYGDCGRTFQESQRAFFDSFAGPVFYTPGNNEWSDCWKENRNSADPTEILKLMREVFFREAKSMGKTRMPLIRQADADARFSEFAENAHWNYGKATFGTLHMVGTHNNQDLRVEKYWREFVRREKANIAWAKAVFSAARSAEHRAVILSSHSNPFDAMLRHERGPFEPVLRAIISEADAFDGQVLLIHGHYHEFIVDRPVTELDLDVPEVRHPNITRLQVYGWPDMKAVQVTVDTSKPWIFAFEPLYAGESVSTNPDND